VIIKLILLAALGSAGWTLVRGRRSALSLLVRRAGALLVVALGIVAVIWPDGVTRFANLLDVGRGTDLVVYVLCVTFLFTTIGLHLRLATMHDKFVELSRRVAINEARADQAEQAQAELAATQRSSAV
jgi:small membrane protein